MSLTKKQHDAVNYNNMSIGESKYIVGDETSGYKEETYKVAYANAGIKITKNALGPKIEYLAKAGLFHINTGKGATKPIEQVDVDLFGASSNVSHSNTHLNFKSKCKSNISRR